MPGNGRFKASLWLTADAIAQRVPHIGLDRNRAARVRQIHMADRATTPASPLRRPSPCTRILVACSDAAIFVGFPESFPTLLIASLLVWIFCFTFFFHI